MGDFYWKSKGLKSVGVDDMVLLPKIEVVAISDNLQKRLMEDLIYCYIGSVLIAVNPFKALPYFTDKELEMYTDSVSYENPPHIYALCDCVFRNLVNDAESQCVIISGESGAGKTVSAKYVMNFITKVSGGSGDVQRVKDIILQSNPLLEAFGNAKTLRNDNSSRFGKYVEILFQYSGTPSGGRISNFLLEKSRIVTQNKGERNFHIFYQLLSGLDAKSKKEFSLGSPEDYYYLRQSECYTVNGIDDAKEYEDVLIAMKTVGLPQDVQDAIKMILAGILHLGNISFIEEKNQAKPKSEETLNLPAKLFQVEKDGLLKVLISRDMDCKFGNKSEKIKMELNVEQAIFARDALAKAIYSRIFPYLVESINKAIDVPNIERAVGILDIYGFEIFQQNGFEQFCINFVNEKLQQIFIELTLKVEQEEYVAEGIEWTPIKYFNNKIVCDLFESKKSPPGIFSILDDVCATMHAKSEGADQKLIEDLGKTIGTHNHFFLAGQGFMIHHYAGKVTYEGNGFCERNRDVLFNDSIDLMKSSKCTFLQSLFPEDTSSDKKGRPTTAGAKIRAQANILVEKLMKCNPHYIRCIKPNETKKPHDFDQQRVKHQIEYQGLKENIRIKRAGFAYRCPFGKFLQRFAVLTPETYPTWKGDEKQGIAHLMDSVSLDKTEWQLGKTKVFVKKPESLFLLEEVRDRKFDGFARTIQKQWRLTNNQSVFDKAKMAACEMVKGKKQRCSATINRKFYGNYYNLDDVPNLLTFMEKKEKVQFSCLITKYDRQFKTSSRDFLITQKSLYIIGREKISKGTEKGKIIDVVKRKLEVGQIKEIQMSGLQDDFICLHVLDDYSTLMTTPLKTELVYVLSKLYAQKCGKPLPLTFKNQFDVFIKKTGFRFGSHLTVLFQENDKLPNNICVLKSSMSKLVVSVKPGEASTSVPKTRVVTESSYAKQTSAPQAKAAPPSPAPKQKTPPSTPAKITCIAQWDYTANEPSELSFKAGDVIEVLKQDENGWWSGKLNGATGEFPFNYTQLQ